MEKITFTYEEIKKDCRSIFFIDILKIVLLAVFLTVVLPFPISIILNGNFAIILPICTFCPFLVILIYTLFISLNTIKVLIPMLLGEFSVTTATLGNKQERISKPYRHIGHHVDEPYQPHILFFSKNIKYNIPEEKIFYTWTKDLQMRTDRLFETSDIGDEFYLVTVGKNRKRIVLVYNTQYFEYKE